MVTVTVDGQHVLEYRVAHLAVYNRLSDILTDVQIGPFDDCLKNIYKQKNFLKL